MSAMAHLIWYCYTPLPYATPWRAPFTHYRNIRIYDGAAIDTYDAVVAFVKGI